MLELKWAQPPNDYPSSDGKPMGESDPHRKLMMELIQVLEQHFDAQPHVYVTGNLLWFYREHDRRRHLSPDVMVVFGVPQGARDNYLQWQEGYAPQVVMELNSKSTKSRDTGDKFDLYQQLGVEEYYLFDSRQKPVKNRFRAYRRQGGQFIRVIGESVFSPRLGLELVPVDFRLRLRCPRTGQFLLTDKETARAAQSEVARLRERLRALGIDPETPI